MIEAMGMGLIDVSRAARTAGRAALDLILPPLCLKCRTPVGQPQSLCGTCWSAIRFLSAPHCVQCGIPFPHELGAGVKCAACIARPPVFSMARAAVAYDDASRDLILGFKHADKLENVPLFARWLTANCADALKGADVIMPVPLHWWRLALRRYNQAALLAQAVGRLTQTPVDIATLMRPRATKSQGEMPSARSRMRNVAKAFAVAKDARLAGKSVALVDDVLTTGATVTACVKALRRAGAASVSVVTVARVVRPLSLSL